MEHRSTSDRFCEIVSTACPRLRKVELPTRHPLSSAESYQWLRLARGCPRLTTLDYSLDPVDSDDEPRDPSTDSGLSVADQSHIGDLFDLLANRCREANIPPRFQIKLLV